MDPKVLERLREMGVTPEEARWVTTQPVNLGDLPAVKRQREVLKKLQGILQAQLDDDLTKLDRAREELSRAKNGGGR